MWANEQTFYQIYPLGFCGAPKENDGGVVPRIRKVLDWCDYLDGLGVGAVYFSPLFESDRHGYDTRDYRKIDCRLGGNEDFAAVCGALHERNIRVVLDGVFNHVGRGFWAFQDVLQNREASPYKDWFYLNFGQPNARGDNLSYGDWEGHDELVKLNLQNGAVVEHLFSCIEGWVRDFGIDGLRLDVAYCLDREFLKRLRRFCSERFGPEFFLVGEVLFGDYNLICNDEMLHSCTNYECYKGMHSSFNSGNMFEISYSLNRQFGPENWTLYKGKHLLSFVDNHDVSRIASLLAQPRCLPLIYGLLFGMPGIPCLYYGSEWGAAGTKEPGSDDSLRPCFESPQPNELTALIQRLIALRKEYKALCYGDYRNVAVQSRQLCFERSFEGERVLVAINADENEMPIPFAQGAQELLGGERAGAALPGFSMGFYRL